MIKASLNSDALVVTRITIDFLQTPNTVKALAGLVHQESGVTRAWSEGNGGMWSTETLKKVQELRAAMEEDMARALCTVDDGPRKPLFKEVSGLGEHLDGDAGPDAPSI